jgi:hypothetical protein
MQQKIQLFVAIGTLMVAASPALAATQAHSRNIVVVPPTAAPVLAQAGAEAMYLHSNGDGKTFLYLETQGGRAMSILDVTDPAKVRGLGNVPVAAKGVYDFVQDAGDSGALIRYRDASGIALLDLTHPVTPVLVEEPVLEHAGGAETVGRSGLLLTSEKMPAIDLHRPQTYMVMDTEDIGRPSLLATVPGVTQRVTRTDTGTIFLLNNDGVTMLRRPALEQDQTAMDNQHN